MKKNTEVQERKDNIVIYQHKDGNVELRADVDKETFWATQDQIMRLFDVDQSVVSRHIKNIFDDGEVEEKSNMQKMHNANSDRPITLYSLDIILAVGYRTSSGEAILFRKWATHTLREYLKQGYSLNRYKLEKAPEAVEGLNETLALMGSSKYPGKLKGKLVFKLTKNMEPKK